VASKIQHHQWFGKTLLQRRLAVSAKTEHEQPGPPSTELDAWQWLSGAGLPTKNLT
jgi:hypothetical protein